MGKEEIWAVLCVCNFLKFRSKNAEAFLNIKKSDEEKGEELWQRIDMN